MIDTFGIRQKTKHRSSQYYRTTTDRWQLYKNMNYFKTIIFLIFIYSCKGTDPKVKTISRIDSLKNSLIGKWGGLDESKPVLRITHDSIYYYNQNKSYPYEIAGNDLVINNGLSKPHLRNISVIKDTLFFETRVSIEEEIYGIVKAFRHN